MKKIFKILSLALCVGLSVGIANYSGIKVNAHTHGGYSHDASVNLDMNNWMAGLSDDLTINQISIPGTGNSMSYGKHTDFTLTQSMDLKTQLNSGIRFLDLTLSEYGDNNLEVVTGLTNLGYSLADVVEEVRDFLNRNINEFVIIKISERDSEYGNFGYAVKNHLERKGFGDLIFDASNNKNPKLKDVRGKIVILSDYSGNKWKTIPYRHNASIQDSNTLNSNWDLYSKWEKVKKQLHDANRNKSGNIRYINYLSGSGGALPYFVASGHSSSGTGDPRLSTGLTEPGFRGHYPDFPRVNRLGAFATIAFEGTNVLALNEIVRDELGFVGIVVADFPGAGLIREIIATNFNSKPSIGGSGNTSSGGSGTTSGGGFGFTYNKSSSNDDRRSSGFWSN